MHVCLVKINGWPDTFDERVQVLASNVDHISLVRPAFTEQREPIGADNVTVHEIYPRRGESIDALWLHTLLFPLYVIQTVAICSILLLRSATRPDVLHALDYVLGGLAITIVGRIFNVPCVVSVRGLTEPRYKQMAVETGGLVPRVNYRIVSSIPRFVLPRVDAVVTKAAYQQEYLMGQFGIDVPIETIPTGVDFEVFDPEQIECGPIIDEVLDGRDRPAYTILHLGNLTEKKGLDRLVSLVEKSRQDLPEGLVFLTVGRFKTLAFEEQIRDRCDDLVDRIHLHPTPIPFDRVPELLACVEGVVLLSDSAHEGTPRVLQEACAMERPIIASDVAGIHEEFSGLSGCYLIDRFNEQDFREAVYEIIGGDLEMNRTEFQDRFDIHNNYAKYVDIYTTAIDNWEGD